jgi:predicted GNAT family N-acyltransferase
MKLVFKIVPHASKEWKKAVTLREGILRKPLGSYFTPEELAEEKNHIHVVGIINDNIEATAVLVPEGKQIKMQRVVVSDVHRNLNIGSNMMAFCEEYAMKEGYKIVYCHARNSAVNFYLKNGYLAEGEYFDEDGIPHLKMYKTIA